MIVRKKSLEAEPPLSFNGWNNFEEKQPGDASPNFPPESPLSMDPDFLTLSPQNYGSPFNFRDDRYFKPVLLDEFRPAKNTHTDPTQLSILPIIPPLTPNALSCKNEDSEIESENELCEQL